MKLSQNDRVLAYLKQYGSITQREAIKHLNIYRLSARIYDLKKRGESILMISTSNIENSNLIYYATYYLETK